jgi:hypothetical protein
MGLAAKHLPRTHQVQTLVPPKKKKKKKKNKNQIRSDFCSRKESPFKPRTLPETPENLVCLLWDKLTIRYF